VEEARKALAEWDAVYRRGSLAAAIYDRIRRQIPREVPERQVTQAGHRASLEQAIALGLQQLKDTQGPDPAEWRWGRIHRSEFPHSLVEAFDIPAVERSGGAGTVAATGATYRHIIDFSDLDASLASNAPGQSGRPGSPYYGNLAENWGAGGYFPLLFSRDAVEARAEHRLVLKPRR
jgi:penicillin amidase